MDHGQTADEPLGADAATTESGTSRRPGWRRPALTALGLVAVFTLVFGGMLYAMQDRIIYPRTAAIPAGPGWKPATIKVTGVGRLRAWWKPPSRGRPVILFFHGNATSIEGVLRGTVGYADKGYGVLAPEYPGYAGNPGTPCEATIRAEADASVAWLAANGIGSNRIVAYGTSLGSGPAIQAATHAHLALVVVSGIADMEDLARSRVGPFAPLVRDKWRNSALIATVPGHKIVVHGATDGTVGYDQGVKLAAAARVPLITLPGGHGIAYDSGLQEAIAQSIERRMRARP